MKKQYYILGCGGFSKEIYFLADHALDDSNQFMGFIDLNPDSETIKVRGREVPLLNEKSFLENIKPDANTSLFIGVGEPALIHKLSKTFHNYNFPNLIHPNFVGDIDSIMFGKGNIITSGCIFTVDIQIGSFNVFNLNTTLGHDAIIGDCNVFNPGVNISGGVVIGSRNLIGTNATILQMIKIEDDNILGASSLANKNIDCGRVMVGVPAKKIL